MQCSVSHSPHSLHQLDRLIQADTPRQEHHQKAQQLPGNAGRETFYLGIVCNKDLFRKIGLHHPRGEAPLHEPLQFVKRLINMRKEASDGLSETLSR